MAPPLDTDVKMIPTGEESSFQVSTSSSTKNHKHVEIKMWKAVALEASDAMDDINCAICKNHINDLCSECQASGIKEDCEDCVVTWGACNHAFHYHCISQWVQIRNVCPLDNIAWTLYI